MNAILNPVRKLIAIIIIAVFFIGVKPNGAPTHTVLDEENCRLSAFVASDAHIEGNQPERLSNFGTMLRDIIGTAEEDEMNRLMDELGTIQDELTLHDFYTIDAKVEEVARALGLLDLGLDRDVTDLSGGQRTKVLLAKLLLEKPDILLLDHI